MAAFSIAALHTELTTDPVSMGYLPLVQKANDQAVADLINSLTSPGVASIFRNDVKPPEVLNAIVAADFAAMTQLAVSQLQLFLSQPFLDATLSNTRTIFLNIFTGMSATRTALSAVFQRNGSRAEVLWGAGFVVTPAQAGAAR